MFRIRTLAAGLLAGLPIVLTAPGAALAVPPAPLLVPGAPAPLGQPPLGVIASADGTTIGVPLSGSGGLDLFPIGDDGSVGAAALTAGSAVTGASQALSPDGTRMVQVNGPTVTAYTVSGGSPTVAGVPQPLLSGTGSSSEPVYSPDGRLLVVPTGTDDISIYSVAADGSLSPAPGLNGPSWRTVTSAAFSPDGRLLAVTDALGPPLIDTGPGSVTIYTVSSNGALAQLTSAPTGGYPAIASFSPDGRYLAVSDFHGLVGGGEIDLLAVAADGSLSPMPAIVNPDMLAGVFSPLGDTLATITTFTTPAPALQLYRVDAGGATAVGNTISFPGSVTGLSFTNHGRGLAAAQQVSYVPDPGGGIFSQSVAFPGSLPQLGAGLPIGANQVVPYSLVQPSAAITAPADGGTYAQGQNVPASFRCQDPSVGVLSCVDSGGAADGTGTLDTATAGPHTYSVTATDAAGQRFTRSLHYTVQAPADAATSGATASAPIAAAVPAPSSPEPVATALPVPNPAAVPDVPLDILSAVPVPGGAGAVRVTVQAPEAGRYDLLATAWQDNFTAPRGFHVSISGLLPAPLRFAFGHTAGRLRGSQRTTLIVRPNATGRRLMGHHRYRVTVRVWVRFVGADGRVRRVGVRHIVLTRAWRRSAHRPARRSAARRPHPTHHR